jgi:hypothetical protein
MQQQFWAGAAIAGVLAIIAFFGERRARGRRTLGRVGWVPWLAIQMAALMTALLCVSLALNAPQ